MTILECWLNCEELSAERERVRRKASGYIEKSTKKLPEAMGFEELSLLINGGFRLLLSNYLEA